MRIARFAAILACCLVAAACTGKTPVAQPTDPSPAPTVSPTAPPPTFGSRPLWTQDIRDNPGATVAPDAIGGLWRLWLLGDAVLTIGTAPGDHAAFRIVVRDAKSGTLRWSATRGDRVAGSNIDYDFLLGARVVSDPAGGWSVVAPYSRPLGGDTYEFGVMGLAGRDGSLQWHFPVGNDERCTCPGNTSESPDLGPATSTTAVVGFTRNAGSPTIGLRAVGYDIATGNQRWTADGVQWRTIDGNLLLVERPQLPFDITTDHPVTLSALDVETGAPKWDLAGRYSRSELIYAAGDTLVVGIGGATVLVDAATGQELASYLAPVADCDRSISVFVCRDTTQTIEDDPAVLITRTGQSATVTRIPNSHPCYRIRVWDALIFCDWGDGPTASVAIDASGRVASTTLPGRLEAANDGYAVFSAGPVDRQEDGSYRVYGR